MISLIIRPGDQISRYVQMLADEYGTASNIKNRVNRQSVLGAITSTQQKLKLFNRTPENGLVIYCGTVIREDGKEKHVNLSLEPHKPINTSLYLCDNKFHTEVRSKSQNSKIIVECVYIAIIMLRVHKNIAIIAEIYI
jgi:peptide chain release factor subunit 1